MKTIKEEADALVNSYTSIGLDYWTSNQILTKCSILSVEHTIEVLEQIRSNIDDAHFMGMTEHYINEQTELLTELKSKL